MTTYDYYQRPLDTWQKRTTWRIAAWADHHPIPFLRGTDGCTWRQRQAGAKAYLKIVSSTPEDRARSRAWAEEWAAKKIAAAANEAPMQRRTA